MPTSLSGVVYYQLPTRGGGADSYSETFERDGNTFTAYLACAWQDAQQFREDIVGYTTYPGSGSILNRTLSHICPYAYGARGHRMTMVNYGRMPAISVTGFDADVAASSIANGGTNTAQAFWKDSSIQDWWQTHFAIYRVDYARLIYSCVPDLLLPSSSPGAELSRFITRRWVNNVRELRTPDYNFQPVGGSPNIIRVNGFIPTVESEYVYTWFQVPFRNVPTNAINACRLKINAATFDATTIFPLDGSSTFVQPGFEAQTMLFIDAKGYDLPYQGADGAYYVDIQYIFRRKRNIVGSSTVVGHNHFLNAAGVWTEVERIQSPNKKLYELTSSAPATFESLFTPQP